uniref:Arginine/serine-rich protein PNISR n=1 Tax=Panagrolaimus davidi TaxID=227884 RepID=A0A914Q3V1_9BILA
MEQGNFLNQSHYENLPNNEVNWGLLAQQWIHQNRPNPDLMQWPQQQQPQHQPPFHRPPGPPQGHPHGGGGGFFNNQPSQQLGPMFNNHYPPQRPPYPPPPQHHQMYEHRQQYPPRMEYPPRMDYFNGPPQHPPYPHQMPPQHRPMGRPPSLFEVRPQWGGPDFSHRHPIHEPRHQHPPPPQAPLFPSAASTRPTRNQDPYHWPEQVEAPPPPPPPTWLESDGTRDGDYSALDTNERKQLPAWIREGLEQMEKEKRLREEKEERRKLQEAAERAREEARKAKGKSKFDSDSEEEEVEKEPVKRKFEEYPDRRPLTSADKEHLTNEAVKSVLIELLLESTKKLLKNCAENALATVKTKRGGSSSEEEDNNDDETSKINDEKNGKSGETKVEYQKADGRYLNESLNKRRSRTRSRSPHHSRSRSPKERHRYHSSRDDYDEDSTNRDYRSDHRRFSEGNKSNSSRRRSHQSRD